METKLVVFKDKKIRRTLHNEEWWFSVADVVEALTDSSDPRQYIKQDAATRSGVEFQLGYNLYPP